jgi:hypothetical protein
MYTIVAHNILSEMLTWETDETTIRHGTLGAHYRFAEADVEGDNPMTVTNHHCVESGAVLAPVRRSI